MGEKLRVREVVMFLMGQGTRLRSNGLKLGLKSNFHPRLKKIKEAISLIKKIICNNSDKDTIHPLITYSQ